MSDSQTQRLAANGVHVGKSVQIVVVDSVAFQFRLPNFVSKFVLHILVFCQQLQNLAQCAGSRVCRGKKEGPR